MEFVKNFLKNKAIGYFIAVADALLAIVLIILFYATYKTSMPNNAAGIGPETIGVFAIAGLLVELVVLALPQYRFIHIAAIAMFALSMYKEVCIIPNLIADVANNVHFQGGSFGINLAYLIIQFIIVVSGIVACFLGLYKSEEEANADMPIKGMTKIATVAVGAVVVIASVLTSSLVSKNIEAEALKAHPITSSSQSSEDKPQGPTYDLITDDIRSLAEEKMGEYGFDPMDVLIKEQPAEDYDFNDPELTSLQVSETREGHYLVYYFEGAYAEGYQGDYSETYSNIYLWDDGLFAGKAKDTTFKGYWFNSSIKNGQQTIVNEETEEEIVVDVKDCLQMISTPGKYESIRCDESTGFYSKSAYIYLDMGWGTRSTLIFGFEYYPEVALVIDTGYDPAEPLVYHVGETFDYGTWTAERVIANCKAAAVHKNSDVKWTVPTGMCDNNGKLLAAGEYEITAKYKDFEASVTVTVEEAIEEAE